MLKPSAKVVIRLVSKRKVLRFLSSVKHLVQIDYADYLDRTSGSYSTQICLWEGAFRQFIKVQRDIGKNLSEVSRHFDATVVDLNKTELEVVVFTETDNQGIELPQSFLAWAAETNSKVSVQFFRTSETR